MKEQFAVQKFLQGKLSEAQSQNPRYSLRAFANRVGLSPGALSAILNGKRSVSKKLAERICTHLLLDPQERSELLKHFPVKGRRIQTDSVDPSYLELSAAQFRVIGDWEHYAILSLMNTRGFKSNPTWIATRLGITVSVTKAAIERLQSIGMIEKSAQGTLTRSKPRFRSTDDIADISLRKSHEQTLDLAKASLNQHAVQQRDHTAITMAIDPSKLPLAKEAIRKFQDEISELLEKENQTEVYRLAIQLFPLTKLSRGEKQ